MPENVNVKRLLDCLRILYALKLKCFLSLNVLNASMWMSWKRKGKTEVLPASKNIKKYQ